LTTIHAIAGPGPIQLDAITLPALSEWVEETRDHYRVKNRYVSYTALMRLAGNVVPAVKTPLVTARMRSLFSEELDAERAALRTMIWPPQK